MGSWLLNCCAIVLVTTALTCNGNQQTNDLQLASVSFDAETDGYILHPGVVVADSVAHASFLDTIALTGWSYLEVYTNGSYRDEEQAYAAGMVEGFLTTDLMSKHWRNTLKNYCTKETEYCNRLRTFLENNLDFLNANILAHSRDPYWHQVSLILNQVSGIEDGHNGRHDGPRTRMDVFGDILVNMMGDLEDLEGLLNKTALTRVVGGGSCSALVKLLPGNSDVLFSHDTWSVYSSMLRILKKYSFQFRTSPKPGATLIPGNTVTFSSYPGMIFSGDDFYLISSGLAVMETTNSNGNTSLWKYITPTTVFDWTRNIVANRLATTGHEWTLWFRIHNSGTYNNQFMILDYKLFKPGQPLRDGLLYVLEQLPGYTESADVTDVLRNHTYWASYNTPYFPKIFNMSGAPAMVAKFGDWFDYEKTPRAQIFRRDHSTAHDLTSMIKLMRYNNFTNDPLSRCNCTPPYSAENAISARCDLNDPNGKYPFGALGYRPHGGTDNKVTSSRLFTHLQFKATSGPAFNPLPAFQWSTSGLPDPHEGHPDIWNFAPVLHVWGNANATYARID